MQTWNASDSDRNQQKELHMLPHSVIKSGSSAIGTRCMCTPSMISYGICEGVGVAGQGVHSHMGARRHARTQAGRHARTHARTRTRTRTCTHKHMHKHMHMPCRELVRKRLAHIRDAHATTHTHAISHTHTRTIM